MDILADSLARRLQKPKRLRFSWPLLAADAVLLAASVWVAARLLARHRQRRGAWLRFSLLELLLLVMVIGSVAGWLANHRIEWSREQRAVSSLAADEYVNFFQAYRGPEWLARLWPALAYRGKYPPFRTTDSASIFCRPSECLLGCDTSDESVRQLPDVFRHLASLKWLRVSGALQPEMALRPVPKPNAHVNFRITDPEAFGSIDRISFSDFDVSEPLLADVAALPRLRLLDIGGKLPRGARDRALSHIEKCSALEELRLGDDEFTDADLAHLVRLTRLRGLMLWAPKLTDASLDTLAQFKSLEDLWISESANLTDGGIRSLIGRLPNLKTFTPPDVLSSETLQLLKNRNIPSFGYEEP